MPKKMAGFLAFFFFILAISMKFKISKAGHTNDEGNKSVIEIGGVIDGSTRIGREEMIAMNIAVHDFYNSTGYNMSLITLDLSLNSGRAAFAAIDLIQNRKVRSVVGALTWQEAEFVSEMYKVPIISLTLPEMPLIFPKNELPVVRMFHDISVHISVISAIVDYFKWRKVIALYEETNLYTSNLGIITLLSTSLRDVGVELEDYSAFPPMSSLSIPSMVIHNELDKLKGKQSKVFILLRSSLTLATLLFDQANRMGMMEKGYVWIIAEESAPLIDSFNLSMQGIISFKAHYSNTSPSFKEFEVKFKTRFQDEYPKEMNPCPSLYAVRAYDAIWTIGKMLQNSNNSKTFLQHIDFEGLSGRIHFENSKLADLPTFRIFNIAGKSYKEIGFYNGERKNLTIDGEIYWPGGTISTPTGLSETNIKIARIAVLVSSKFTHFVKVVRDVYQNKTYISGFSVHVFESAAKYLQYPLVYNLIPFYGSRDDMIKEVSINNFDAGIGDILITASKNRLVEFSHPYIESNLVMVVSKAKLNEWKQSWMFMKPFSKGMWIAMAVMTVYTGLVVWFLEHRINSDFRGPLRQQIATSLWFAFSTLTFAHRESIRNQWSRLVLVPWLFLIMIITSTYTANLTAMLTNPLLEPDTTDTGSLKRTNAVVGCDGNSFIIWYLTEVLEFKADNIKSIPSTDDLVNSLSNRHIRAAFMFSPHANVFLSEYCEFAVSGQEFKLNGFGYVFPKGSSLASDMSEAIIHLTQSGELQQLQQEKLLNSKCKNLESNSGGEGLGIAPFSSLFIISGSVSAVAFIVAAFRQFRYYLEKFTLFQTMWINKDFWLWLPTFFAANKAKDEIELSIENCNPPSSISN